MNVAYTIGNFSSYDKSLATEEEVFKTGKYDDYPGGWVWQTKEAALEFIDHNAIIIDGTLRDSKKFAVYEVSLIGDWNSDVSKEVDKDGIHNLLKDALIVRKL